MGVEQKIRMFEHLVRIGFKEIEIGFPSASQIEFDFLRRLVDEKRIPDDVSIQVLCQTREHLIDRTLESLAGVKSAVFHLYTSTSPAQRKITFGMSKDEVKAVAVKGVRYLKDNLDKVPGTNVTLEFSPESFSNTELDFALQVCEAVKDVWRPTAVDKLIFNLPATVESAMPNVHADQIEYFCDHISGRDAVLVSLHTHNDRGTAVAAAELALLAGADRVEGTLFGNGERTGNLDIVTLALNMFSQGIAISLDFADLPSLMTMFEETTGMAIPPRQPYAGDLVFTAFSGSHQDAIRKGLSARKGQPEDSLWEVPYLPIDPRDLNREYEAIIRINSQSGKGGVAWILETEYGINMPKAMHPEFGRIVNDEADKKGTELGRQDLYELFRRIYLDQPGPVTAGEIYETRGQNGQETRCRASLVWNGKPVEFDEAGNGPMDAFAHGLRKAGLPVFTVLNFHEHSVGTGSDTAAMAFTEIALESGKKYWGCGRDTHIGVAGIRSVLSALNNALK
jgi:2-isopropylmalate synthase